MNIESQIRQSLTSLTSFSQGTQSLRAVDAGQSFECELTALDSLALAFDGFAFTHNALTGAAIDRLSRVAATLAQRLTYLLEPISPIETDTEQCAVQLRSSPPQKDDDGARYYELLVPRTGRLTLRRYHKAPGMMRQPIDAQVTREVFLRLVKDFAAAV